MTSGDVSEEKKAVFKAFYGMSKIPFDKSVWAKNMFDSKSQIELRMALEIFTEIKGFALVVGPAGIGKSITLRRFVQDLNPNRFTPIEIISPATTIYGFLRHLARKLKITVKHHAADIFDDVQNALMSHEEDRGTHPILAIDDAESIRPAVLDVIKKLSTAKFDSENKFSVLLSGTEQLIRTLDQKQLEPLRSRFAISAQLRPFGFEDTLGYIKFHLEKARARPDLFTEGACRQIFQASRGVPRIINQLAIHGLVFSAVWKHKEITASSMKNFIAQHPIYGNNRTAS